MIEYDNYRDARSTIAALTTCNPTIDSRCANSTAPFCIHFDNNSMLRNLLIDIDDTPTTHPADFADDPITHALLRASLRTMIDYDYSTHELSMMRLDHSLCPLHHIDYAICFDDDDPDCATIRALFPSHDT